MSDLPAGPVPAHEPPYYAVVFTSLRTPAADADAGAGGPGLAETAARLGEAVGEIPGFLGEDSARTPGGLAVTVAYFRDLAGIEQWRRDPGHRAAKERGRRQWYEEYTLHIARVEHSHGFRRPAAPAPAASQEPPERGL